MIGILCEIDAGFKPSYLKIAAQIFRTGWDLYTLWHVSLFL